MQQNTVPRNRKPNLETVNRSTHFLYTCTNMHFSQFYLVPGAPTVPGQSCPRKQKSRKQTRKQTLRSSSMFHPKAPKLSMDDDVIRSFQQVDNDANNVRIFSISFFLLMHLNNKIRHFLIEYILALCRRSRVC